MSKNIKKVINNIYAPIGELPNLPDLEPIYHSTYCQFSAIENKLEVLYKNQEKIYAALKFLLNR